MITSTTPSVNVQHDSITNYVSIVSNTLAHVNNARLTTERSPALYLSNQLNDALNDYTGPWSESCIHIMKFNLEFYLITYKDELIGTDAWMSMLSVIGILNEYFATENKSVLEHCIESLRAIKQIVDIKYKITHG